MKSKTTQLTGQFDLVGVAFEPPPPKLVPKKTDSPPTWGRLLVLKHENTCTACATDQHEAALKGDRTIIRRIARYRRSCPGELPMLLCHRHTDLQREADGLPEIDHNANGTKITVKGAKKRRR